MIKSQLIEELAKRAGISLRDAERAVNAAIESMAASLADNRWVELRGLGSFKVKDYGGYSGRHPRTNKVTEIRAKKLSFFKLGKELKERLNGQRVDGE